MKYSGTVTLKDGRTCAVRSAAEKDAQAVLANFILTHEQTDFLTTYPEETTFTVETERAFLKRKAESAREVQLVAEIDGEIVGTAGVDLIRDAEKTRHRAAFGISVDKAWWGLGVGRALTEACVECAKAAGFRQLELEVVSENVRALALYRSVGFVEYGKNPKAFLSRTSGWQENVLMRLELDR